MLAFLAEAVGSFLLGWIGKLLGRRQAKQEGAAEQRAQDAQDTLKEIDQARKVTDAIPPGSPAPDSWAQRVRDQYTRDD